MNKLQEIEHIIRDYSAITFANSKLDSIKNLQCQNYHSYMRDCFSGEDNPSIEQCEQNAFLQFINDYKKLCEIYAGWIANGKVFILDKFYKVVLFLYKRDEVAHSSVVHYNPLNVDLIEMSCPNDVFFTELYNGRFDVSQNESQTIKECNALIYNNIL